MFDYLFRLVAYVPFLAVAVALAPCVALFARPAAGRVLNGKAWAVEPRLPSWLAWFMTPDNSLWGDAGWRTEYCPDFKSYWGMVKWLWRNPAYGFAWGPLAFTPSAACTYVTTGDTSIRARDNARAGTYAIKSSDGAFERTVIWQIARLPVCLKVRFGWILGKAKPGVPCLFLLSIRLMNFRQ